MSEEKKKNHTLTIVLTISLFFVGLIAGMLFIHFTEAAGLKSELDEAENTIINVNQPEIVKVYVPKRKIEYGTIPINSYNCDNFKIDEGFMAYFDENGNKISHLGVDISYHQESIDWETLKSSPCEFLMIRCGYRGYTEGGLVEDEKFREYADAATEAGIPFGVYFFTQAITEEEAIAEADFAMSLVQDYDLSYPLAIDTEYISDDNARTNLAELTNEERTKLVTIFCDRVKEFGYYPLIYASENWLRRYLDASMIQEYEIWAPQYLDKNDFMYDFTIWQYAEDGAMPGIPGKVDLNISMVDYAAFVPKMREAYLSEQGEIIEVSE